MVNFFFSSIALTGLAYTSVNACAGGLHKRQNTEILPFTYTGTTGPLAWGHINPQNFSACRLGTRQSPIDLTPQIRTVSTPITLNWPDTLRNISFENTGATVELVIPEEADLRVNIEGKEYRLDNIHFHTPSEHRWQGEWYPLEAHCVTRGTADRNQIAVIGFFLEVSSYFSVSLLDTIWNAVEAIRLPKAVAVVDTVNLGEIKAAITANPANFTTYAGSLTAPPCSENVQWYVAKNPLRIAVQHLIIFKNVLKFNSRYTQSEFAAEGQNRQNLLDFVNL